MTHQTTYLIDGCRYRASTAACLVRLMHTMSRTPAADDQAWMEDVAERTVLQDGGKVRVCSPEAFIADLISCGLIKPCPEVRDATLGEQFD